LFNYRGVIKMPKPAQFHVTAFSNGVLLGTAIAASAHAFVNHMLAVHDKTSNVEMTVYPYSTQHTHMRGEDGHLYPLFVYRSGRESMLTHAQLEEMLIEYAEGKAQIDAVLLAA